MRPKNAKFLQKAVVPPLSAGLCVLFSVSATAEAQDPAKTSTSASALQTPVGLWRTQQGRSHIRIFECGEKLCGKIVWLREAKLKDGSPIVDARNPDPKLRDRPVVGLTVIWGFTKSNRPGRWAGGRMYHPEEGKYYKGALTLRTDGRLRVRGYRRVPVVGKTQYWTRLKDEN